MLCTCLVKTLYGINYNNNDSNIILPTNNGEIVGALVYLSTFPDISNCWSNLILYCLTYGIQGFVWVCDTQEGLSIYKATVRIVVALATNVREAG